MAAKKKKSIKDLPKAPPTSDPWRRDLPPSPKYLPENVDEMERRLLNLTEAYLVMCLESGYRLGIHHDKALIEAADFMRDTRKKSHLPEFIHDIPTLEEAKRRA